MRIKKTVYTQTPEIARERGEFDRYLESNRINADCAKAIDKSIIDSNYEPFHYSLKDAAKAVAEIYGEKRMAWVVANTIQSRQPDRRFSQMNKEWANKFEIPPAVRITYHLNSHSCLVDGFANATRDLCAQKSKKVEKPKLAERLEDGKRKAEQNEKLENTRKSNNREVRE
jgi:hypothetical protein